jgi:hypothetical protein
MNPLLFQCPNTRQPVAVGLRIDYASVRNVQPVKVSLICPLCNEPHEWHLHEGLIEEPPEPERTAPPPPPFAPWSPCRESAVRDQESAIIIQEEKVF